MLEGNGCRVNKFRPKAVLFLVTGAGVGYIPRLPGTLGTMIALPFSLALNHIALGDFPLATMILIGSIGCAVCLCTQASGILKQKDSQFIVIDEIVGFLLANFLAPPRLTALLCSFAFFRFFDISKVSPANRLGTITGRSRHCAGRCNGRSVHARQLAPAVKDGLGMI